jgi:thiol:disulfide interchange protein
MNAALSLAHVCASALLTGLLLGCSAESAPPVAASPNQAKTSAPDHSAQSKGMAWRQPAEWDAVLAEAKASKRLVMVDFWTSWCGPCKRMMKETFTDVEVVTASKSILCVSVDAESKDGVPLAARYGVQAYPTILFVRADGSVASQSIGFKSAPDFLDILARVAKL